MKRDRLFKTVLVIGDNHEDIIKKYSESYQVEPYLYLKREDVSKRKQQHIDELEKTIKGGTLNQQQILLTKEYIEIIKETPDLEYFLDITKGCTYDTNTNDAYSTANPNPYYRNERTPQTNFEKTGEESGFCTPFKLYDDYISYSATKNEIDWTLNNSYNKEVYEAAWELVVEDREAVNPNEIKIKENMKNRIQYFNNFKDKDEYVKYSTAFWTYGIATEEKYEEMGKDEMDWINNFYDRYIKPLPEDTRLTLYEVQNIE